MRAQRMDHLEDQQLNDIHLSAHSVQSNDKKEDLQEAEEMSIHEVSVEATRS